jgi:hypothetical protein
MLYRPLMAMISSHFEMRLGADPRRTRAIFDEMPAPTTIDRREARCEAARKQLLERGLRAATAH